MRLSTPLLTTLLLALAHTSPIAVPITSPEPIPATALLEDRATPLNAFLTTLLDTLPEVNGFIGDVVGVLTKFESLLAFLTGEKTTYNGLSGSACKKFTVLFARGTSEPGNVGILVGPPFFDALRSKVGSANLAVQGVNNYDASVDGYLEGGNPAGSASMAAQINQAKALCPNTKLIASGYSQGGQIVHNAMAMLSPDAASFVGKVVIFGDPNSQTPIPNIDASKVKIFCNEGDNICVNGDLILLPHLTYAENAEEAAVFATS